MIFITVGTQLPFDRLILLVDKWKFTRKSSVEVVAQVGKTNLQHLSSSEITLVNDIEPDVFTKYFERAEVIVSHAGMGSILTALKLKKPIIIFPRLARLNEHRNDHQLATVNAFKNTYGVYPAFDEQELYALLDRAVSLVPGQISYSNETKELISYLNCFIKS